jgi:exonuclease VII large subunit
MTAAEIWAPTRHAWSRPRSAADMAQARLFDEILESEIAELEELAEDIEARSADRHQQGHSRELRRLNVRIDEVRRLLDALRDRFPAM